MFQGCFLQGNCFFAACKDPLCFFANLQSNAALFCFLIQLSAKQEKTSQERPKSALYLRLKKCKIFKICSWRFLNEKLTKKFHPKKPSVLGKRFRRSDIAAGTNASTCFRTSASSSVKRNILRK